MIRTKGFNFISDPVHCLWSTNIKDTVEKVVAWGCGLNVDGATPEVTVPSALARLMTWATPTLPVPCGLGRQVVEGTAGCVADSKLCESRPFSGTSLDSHAVFCQCVCSGLTYATCEVRVTALRQSCISHVNRTLLITCAGCIARNNLSLPNPSTHHRKLTCDTVKASQITHKDNTDRLPKKTGSSKTYLRIVLLEELLGPDKKCFVYQSVSSQDISETACAIDFKFYTKLHFYVGKIEVDDVAYPSIQDAVKDTVKAGAPERRKPPSTNRGQLVVLFGENYDLAVFRIIEGTIYSQDTVHKTHRA
ncbi:hypothetical protein J6590_013562 [Homalodisca vitripennis]|nr:hypothetical protein J6590_013562 [Homalodisca vitripennis]